MFFSYYFYYIFKVTFNFNYKFIKYLNYLPAQKLYTNISINNEKIFTKHIFFLIKSKFLIFSFSVFFFKLNSFFFFLNKINYYYFQLFFFKNFRFLKNFFFFLKITNKRLFILDVYYKKVIKNLLVSLRIIFYELKFFY